MTNKREGGQKFSPLKPLPFCPPERSEVKNPLADFSWRKFGFYTVWRAKKKTLSGLFFFKGHYWIVFSTFLQKKLEAKLPSWWFCKALINVFSHSQNKLTPDSVGGSNNVLRPYYEGTLKNTLTRSLKTIGSGNCVVCWIGCMTSKMKPVRLR